MGEKINYSELAEHLRKMAKRYKLYEDGEKVASAIVDKDNILSNLRDEETLLAVNVERIKVNLGELESVKSKLKQAIRVCETEIAGKVKKTKEELEYLEGEVKAAKAELDGISVKSQAIGNQVIDKKIELDEASVELDKKTKECVEMEGKKVSAAATIQKLKDTL